MEHSPSWKSRGPFYAGVKENGRESDKELVSGARYDRDSNSGRSLKVRQKILQNPQIRVQSGTVPETSQNSKGENKKPTEDRSHNDLDPEVCTFIIQSPEFLNSDSDEASYSHN